MTRKSFLNLKKNIVWQIIVAPLDLVPKNLIILPRTFTTTAISPRRAVTTVSRIRPVVETSRATGLCFCVRPPAITRTIPYPGLSSPTTRGTTCAPRSPILKASVTMIRTTNERPAAISTAAFCTFCCFIQNERQ